MQRRTLLTKTTFVETKLFETSYTLNQLENLVPEIWDKYLSSAVVITFKGEMGAGKTTFISALMQYLGGEDSVSSPTFSIVNEYHYQHNGVSGIVYHMDWYRIKNVADAINSGMEDLLSTSPNNYCLIEWAENAAEILPVRYIKVSLETPNPTSRNLVVYQCS